MVCSLFGNNRILRQSAIHVILYHMWISWVNQYPKLSKSSLRKLNRLLVFITHENFLVWSCTGISYAIDHVAILYLIIITSDNFVLPSLYSKCSRKILVQNAVNQYLWYISLSQAAGAAAFSTQCCSYILDNLFYNVRFDKHD